MTTVVWDGRAMYSDSMATDSYGMKLGSVPKVFGTSVYGVSFVIAVTGDYGAACAAKDWVLRGAPKDDKPDFAEDASFEIIVATPGSVDCYGPDLLPVAVPKPWYCAGSGAAYALAALTLGHSGQEAIELAAKLDSITGGPIQCIVLKELS